MRTFRKALLVGVIAALLGWVFSADIGTAKPTKPSLRAHSAITVQQCNSYTGIEVPALGIALSGIGNQLCVAAQTGGYKLGFWEVPAQGSVTGAQVAGCWHTSLWFNGVGIGGSNSAERCDPVIPFTIQTPTVSHPAGGQYCANLWIKTSPTTYSRNRYVCHTF